MTASQPAAPAAERVADPSVTPSAGPAADSSRPGGGAHRVPVTALVSSGRVPELAPAVLWLVSLVGWLLLWRYPTPSTDDLYFMARNSPDGSLPGWSAWWRDVAFDLGTRNGRTADLVGQLVFATGHGATRVILALVCWATGLASWRWLRCGERLAGSHWVALIVRAVFVLLPFVGMTWDKEWRGGTFFFMSATIGYAGGLLLLFLATWPMMARFARDEHHPRALVLSPLAVVPTVLHHEVLAVAYLGFLVGCHVVHPLARWDRQLRLVAGAGALVALARFATPGLWHRREVASGGRDTGSLFHHLVVGLANVQRVDAWFVYLPVVVLVCTALLAARRPNGPARLVRPAVALAVAGAVWRASGEAAQRAMDATHDWTDTPILLGILVLLSSLGVFVLGALVLKRLGREHRATLICWFTAFGALAVPAAAGMYYGRSVFFTTFLLLAAAVRCAAQALAEHLGDGRELASAVLVVVLGGLCLVGFKSFQDNWSALQHNHEVWHQIELEIADAQAGGTKKIVLPRLLPVREVALAWASGRTYSLPWFRAAYQVPADVELVWGP